jgi:mannose-6-phosphate isomerase-like protein (cupin superfamily)
VNSRSAEHYKWGGAHGTACDGWHLVKTPDLSVIEELMPPGTSEARHAHLHARQFFFVLEVLRAREGLEIAPGQAHQALNRSTSCVRMLVTSQPPGQADRIKV